MKDSALRRENNLLFIRPVLNVPVLETRLLIIGGNTLDSGQPGIKHSTDIVDDVASGLETARTAAKAAADAQYAIDHDLAAKNAAYAAAEAAYAAALDPYDTATTPDYIGRAYIFINCVQNVIDDGSGGLKPEQVLVVSDPRGTFPDALVQGDWVRSMGQIYVGDKVIGGVTSPIFAFMCGYLVSPT